MQTNNAVVSNKSKVISDESVSSNGSNKADDDKPTASSLLSSMNRKRNVDESLLSPAEVESLMERRAYNRECATRARKRVKENISQLERQVKELQDDKAELRRSLVAMEKQVLVLNQEKQELQVKIQILGGGTGSQMMYNNSIRGLTSVLSPPSPHLMQLQQLQQQQQQQQQYRQLNASLKGRGF
jgi:predicted RNase H-like nuclease (RuvC/YqgF family)